MTEYGGIIRSYENIRNAVSEASEMLASMQKMISARSVREVAEGFRLYGQCLTHYVYLSSIEKYIREGGRGRGSFIVSDPAGLIGADGLEESFRYTLCDFSREIENHILEVEFRSGKVVCQLAEVRPIPEQELWFEKVWKKNLEDNLTGC
jgi:hypothetical protein